MIGAPDIRPESFANAITEPENVIAPIAVPSDISSRLSPEIEPSSLRMLKASGALSAPAATNTAARPTSEWNAATSSGIAVIGMRCAM